MNATSRSDLKWDGGDGDSVMSLIFGDGEQCDKGCIYLLTGHREIGRSTISQWFERLTPCSSQQRNEVPFRRLAVPLAVPDCLISAREPQMLVRPITITITITLPKT